jgi:hypothetical protein
MTIARLAGTAVAVSALLLAALPGVAAAQDLYDCGDFEFQEDAQAVFDQDRSDPYRLDDLTPGEGDGVACESLPRRGGPAPTTPPTTPAPTTPAREDDEVARAEDRDDDRQDDGARVGTDEEAAPPAPTTTAPSGDRDCPDFASQADAQAVLDADPSDPQRLDADDDGIACEQHFGDDSRQVQVVPRGGVDTGGRANDA